MAELHFNYKDLFKALKLGFSAKKLIMMGLGLLVGAVLYNIFSYLGFLASGFSFYQIWDAYRVLPIPESLSWYGWVLYGLGVGLFLASILITATAVVKVTYEQLRGDDFFQITEAFKFAFKNINAIFMSWILVIIFIATVVVCGLILSAIGRIPYFGELFMSIFTVIAFFASLFIVYLAIILFFALLYAPVVVGTAKTDTFDTLFEVFSMVNHQTARTIWYTLIVAFLAKVGFVILGLFSRASVLIGINILKIFMGNKILELATNASYGFKLTIPYWCPEIGAIICDKIYTLLSGDILFAPFNFSASNWAMAISSVIVLLSYYVIILFVFAYPFTVLYTGLTASFLVIYKKKDDRNLLEEKEEQLTCSESITTKEGETTTSEEKPEAPPAS
ncbi:MAG: hypothetical protein NZ601_03400 [candidate division WOR-3 bacterium]|nr:hypothetical protein [candidate division WOR-3 bacterium]MCX7756833.1 hypothetical protein [candidate division WOR-3 bacterium]MDW7987518.1 hypothetical protein [candidate division WOR-3 bacterium]